MVSETVSAQEHFGNIPHYAPSQKQYVFCPEKKPCTATKKNLADRYVFAFERLHLHIMEI